MIFDHIEKVFNEHIKQERLTGVVCAIYRNDKEIYRGVFGYSDCAQTKQLKHNSIFRLASMTKPITAIAVLIAQEYGLLDIDEPLGKYIPNFHHSGVGKLIDGNPHFVCAAREVLLRDCLCHCSGFGSGPLGDFQFKRIKKPCSLEENVMSWNGAFLDFMPRSKQAYSGVVAFELLALVVEKVSGISFDKFLKKEIFEPLCMTETKYVLSEDEKLRLVEMTKTGVSGKLEKVDLGFSGFGSFEEGYTGGSAGLFSTIADYSNFVRMLACKGIFNGKKIINTDSVVKMRTPEIIVDKYQSWGLGVRVITKQDEQQPLPISSFGWSGAYGTHFWIEPDTGISALLMINKADVGGSGSIYSREFEQMVSKCNLS